MSDNRYSIWLVPRKDFLISLADCINHNSFISKQPAFIPHMTLFTSRKNILDDFDTYVSQLKYQSIKLSLESLIKNKKSYYMNYYLKLSKTKELKGLFDNIKQLDISSNYQLKPHISLAYGANDFSDFVTYKFSEDIIFDELIIMEYSPAGSAKAVLDFKILKSYNLQTQKLIKY